MTAQTINIDTAPEEDLLERETPESVYLKSEARLNLRKKIKEFRNTLSDIEKFIWDCRIMEKRYTLDECTKYTPDMVYREQVKRLETKVLDKARDYFSSLDFIDVIGG